MMTRTQIKEVVINLLLDLCKEKPEALDEDMNAVRILGLATEDGMDLACLLSLRLKCEVPHNVNPLFNEIAVGSRGYERTVGDIIDLAFRLYTNNPNN